jgi:hypothetical protein
MAFQPAPAKGKATNHVQALGTVCCQDAVVLDLPDPGLLRGIPS